MDKTKALEQIFKTFYQKFQKEMSVLLAQKVVMTDDVVVRADRIELFKSLSTNQVVTEISLDGFPANNCIVLTDLRGALTMGGTLIMLPENEIAERVQRNKLGDDESDAYGEIVNICCGVLSKIFHDLYPENIRFVKGAVSCLDPREVLAAERYPLDPGEIWISRANWSLNGKQGVGQFVIAVHADALGLDAEEQAVPAEMPAQIPSAASTDPVSLEILETVHGQIGSYLGQTLGQPLTLTEIMTRTIAREDLLKRTIGNKVLVRLQVEGDRNGAVVLSFDLHSARTMTGKMTQLPAGGLQEWLETPGLGNEEADKFVELLASVGDIFTSAFAGLPGGKLQFLRAPQLCVTPGSFAEFQADPIACSSFFVTSSRLAMAGRSIGSFEMIFPSELMWFAAGIKKVPESAPGMHSSTRENNVDLLRVEMDKAGSRPHILVFSESDKTATDIIKALRSLDMDFEILGLQTDARKSLTKAGVRGILLIMEEVQEQGIAMAIKIRSIVNPQLPLIAVGPNWTKSMVLRAIKYGVQDILVTPASETQIQEKVRSCVLH